MAVLAHAAGGTPRWHDAAWGNAPPVGGAGSVSNNTAELAGILQALKAAHELSPCESRVTILFDSTWAANAVRAIWRPKKNSGAVLAARWKTQTLNVAFFAPEAVHRSGKYMFRMVCAWYTNPDAVNNWRCPEHTTVVACKRECKQHILRQCMGLVPREVWERYRPTSIYDDEEATR